MVGRLTIIVYVPVKGGRKRRPWGLFSARFPPHSILQGNFKVQYRTTSATLSRTATLFRTAALSRTVLRLILPIPYSKADQKSFANSERSCVVNVKSCSSGGTAWRRKIFRNSRVNGAPLTVFESELIVITCICVGVCVVFDLVAALLADTGRFSHFSMIIVLALRPIEISRTIFTFPLEFSSQPRASCRSLVSDSDHPDSMTMVGRSVSFGRILRGLKAESPSLDIREVLNVVEPRLVNSRRNPIPAASIFNSSLKFLCAASCLAVGTLSIKIS